MMSQAYFVGKVEIMNWINKVIDIGITKIEQLGTGAILCQLLDAFYPNVIPMHKVNWRARSEHEFVINLKIVQKALLDLNFKKVMDVR